MTIKANLYTSGGTLIKSQSCDLSDNTGCTLSGYTITSIGSYYCTVTDSSSSLLSQTSTFSVISDLQVIQVSSTTLTPSAYFDFIITVKLRDKCGTLVSDSTQISLTGTLSILGTLTSTPTSGSSTFTVYCPDAGSQTVTVTAGSLTNTLSLEVQQDTLKFTSFTPTVIFIKPSIENTFFSIVVKVYSYSGSAVASKYGPFTITLTLNPTSNDFTGTFVQDTINGVASFLDIAANMSGTYELIASSPNIISVSRTFTLAAAVLTTIELSASPNPVSTNFDFKVNVTVKDQIGRLWWKSCQIDATGNNLDGQLSQTTQSGFAEFVLRFQQSGNQVLTFSSEGISASLTIIVLKNMIKIVNITPTVLLI